MRRSPRVVLAWLIVAVVAIATARVVAGDLAALHRRARSLGPDVTVLLAARDLPLGSTLTARDLHAVQRPRATVPPDAVRDAGAVLGRVVAMSFARDDVVRAVHLVPADRDGLGGVVPNGRRAMHVVLKDGFRPPLGAVVDVLTAFDAGAPGRGLHESAGTVARGALVLGIDDPGESGVGDGTGVTLLVAEGEANGVAYATGNGHLVLALAPPETACCTPSSPSPAP